MLHEIEASELDASAHLELAALHLDRGEVDRAGEELERARRAASSTVRALLDESFRIVEARIALLLDDPQRAFTRLAL